ncbi:MAG TPA: UDP-glucose/GDP-mannose dehydrogenase family protein [Candidatus Marinimicrobia bacterium]|nr:UDP-glucose/GDP-mannose dehydrogenase family protein [Candidatus Neomarinimicrobiota bacterium]
MKNICVVGTGYVGLVSGTGLADFGNNVVCVDINKEKIDMLLNGKIPIYEPGLKEVLDRNVQAGRLSFSTEVDKAIQAADVVFSAVGTPPGKGGEADLDAVWKVGETFAKNLNSYKIFVNKSTVPVGTGKKVYQLISEKKNNTVGFDVVSNPEFLREGSAVGDFLRPDRVVIGSSSAKAAEIMKDVYRPLYLRETPVVETNIETAELIKYASNAFLAVKITFINEIANLCDIVGGDVHIVAKAMGLDGRISPKFLHPGPGYGGSCFPKDTLALTQIFREHGISTKLVEAAVEVNENQKRLVVGKTKQLLPDLKDKTIAILGLSFKPNTDDTRESPAKTIIPILEDAGAHVQVFDPVAMEDFRRDFPKLDYRISPYHAAENAHAIVLLTEWNEFRDMNLEKLKNTMIEPNFIDTRNVYNKRIMNSHGFRYVGMGRSLID